ncbi:winged helix-turn-helix transcriptional regulator [Streptomyces seoulensis]
MPSTSTGLPNAVWTDPDCPVARTLDLVGDRWSLLVVRDAMDGARSFTEFQRRTGIARNILTDRLRKLTDHGILTQRTAPSGRRWQYVLTDAGRALFPVLLTLRQWGERHAFAPGEPHSTLVDQHGARVPELKPTGTDGAPLDVDTIHVRKTGSPPPG